MTDFNDKLLTSEAIAELENCLKNNSYEGVTEFAQAKDVFHNQLVTAVTEFILLSRKLDPKPKAQDVVDTIIAETITAGVNFSFNDGIDISSMIKFVYLTYAQVARETLAAKGFNVDEVIEPTNEGSPTVN